jgi:hypothetical protein
MKKLLSILVLSLLFSGNAYAKTFKIGLTFDEYYKSCKKYQRFNLINKKNLPSLVGQQGEFIGRRDSISKFRFKQFKFKYE